MLRSFEETEASIEITIARANSRIKLIVARICRTLFEIRSVQSETRRIILIMKVMEAAIMINAAYWLKFLFW